MSNLENNIPISVHSFMFLFRWDTIIDIKSNEDNILSKRSNLIDFHTNFIKCGTLNRTVFNINKSKQCYNEYMYFHSFARMALYDTDDVDFENKTTLYYEIDGLRDDYFQIDTVDNSSYKLLFKSVRLHVFNTGVGILSFNLENYIYNDKFDILSINEFGRRIYPQFLDEHEDGLLAVKKAFLADKIHGKINHLKFEEDFKEYNEKLNDKDVFIAPGFIKMIFNINQKDESNNVFTFNKKNIKKGNTSINLLTDDRMFFISNYKNDNIVKPLSNILEINGQFLYEFQNNDFWNSYIFGSKSIRKDLIKDFNSNLNNTYPRWIKYGTIYGMSRDSFVSISDNDKTRVDMQSMYYQLVIICLVQRASVLRFSYEVSNISRLFKNNINVNPYIKDLYRNYIAFVNNIYFREVTSQIQGHEMYNKIQSLMSIEKDIKDLDHEIQELYNYVSVDEQEKLNKIASWFLPAGIIAGIMGMNAFSEDTMLFKGDTINWSAWGWVGIAILLSIFVAFMTTKLVSIKIKR